MSTSMNFSLHGFQKGKTNEPISCGRPIVSFFLLIVHFIFSRLCYYELAVHNFFRLHFELTVPLEKKNTLK